MPCYLNDMARNPRQSMHVSRAVVLWEFLSEGHCEANSMFNARKDGGKAELTAGIRDDMCFSVCCHSNFFGPCVFTFLPQVIVK